MSSSTSKEDWPLPELTRARRAIVVVDVVESVRLMQEDETGFIERWRRFVHEVRTEVLPQHGGRMVKSLGDGMLLEFEQPAPGMQAALLLQAMARARSLPLRVGANFTEIVIDESDVFGAGVNLAARVATLAEPGTVAITAQLRDELIDGLDVEVQDLGRCWLKHLAEPVQAFSIGPSAEPAARQAGTAPSDLTMTLAVVPLRCEAGAREHQALGDFVADSLIASLSMSPELKVVSRLSTRAVLDRSLDAVSAARQLAAKYLIAGSYYVHAERVEVCTELVDGGDGSVVVARRVSCAIADLFDPVSQPLIELSQMLHQSLLDCESKRVRSRPLPNLASYSLLLGSIGLLHRTTIDDFERARTALDLLIHREPRHGAGYTWLTKWHFLRMIRGLAPSPDRERDEAQRLADEALQRDDHNGTAWALRGLAHAFQGHDLPRAEAAYARALDCNPSEPLAWLYMSTLRSWQGRGPEAVQAAQRALQLSPLDPMRYYFESLAAAAMLADNRFEEAITLARSSLRAHRGHTPTFRVLTIAQMLSDRPVDARATLAQMRTLEPQLTVAQYLDRYPGRDSPHATIYAEALRQAGLPS